MTPVGPIVLLSLLAGTPNIARAESPAIQQLLDNASYWKERGDTAKMVEIYNKILRSNPSHTVSLAELALFYAHEGNHAQADATLARLARIEPSHPQLLAIQQAMSIGGEYDEMLMQARELTASGEYEQAVLAYRDLFANAAPPQDLALEYYQTLGGTTGGWEAAEQGLRSLHSQQPLEKQTSLALAKHLTYREATRREGIQQLSMLSRDPFVHADAVESWKQALLWLEAKRDDAPLYDAYLRQSQGDTEVQQKLAVLTAPVKTDGLRNAFQTLKGGNTAKAESLFMAIHKRKPSSSSRVGLASIAMERGDFDKAVRLLEEARAASPGSSSQWAEPLHVAQYWRDIEQAGVAIENNRQGAAREVLQSAVARGNLPSPQAAIMLVDLDLAAGNGAAALTQLDALDELAPNDPQLTLKRVQAHLSLGQVDEAERINQTLQEQSPETALSIQRLRSQMTVQRTIELTAAGRHDDVEQILREAIAADPDNSVLLRQLAYNYLANDKVGRARATLDALAALEPGSTAVQLTQARVLAAEGFTQEALGTLRSIRIARDKGSDAKERQAIEADIRIGLATQYGADGNYTEARAQLLQLESTHRADPLTLARVAGAWSEYGEHSQALMAIRSAVASAKTNRNALRIQQANILLLAEKYEELDVLLEDLNQSQSLTGEERAALDNIRIGHAVRQADSARDNGMLLQASNRLMPLMDQYQKDARLLAAYGRVLLAADEVDAANTLYTRLLHDHPTHRDVREGAIQAALLKRDDRRVMTLAAQGVQLEPDEAVAYLVAGKAAAQIGRDPVAMEYLQTALTLEDGRDPFEQRMAKQQRGEVMPDGQLTFSAKSSYNEILSGSSTRLKMALTPEAALPEIGTGDLRAEILKELNEVEARHRTQLHFGLEARHRIGFSGLGQLSELKIPVSVHTPTGYAGRIHFSATPVYLTTGELQVDKADQWGVYSLAGQGAPTTTAVGGALMGGWTYKDNSFWIGTTPLGFAVQTMQGGLNVALNSGGFDMNLQANRTPVKDSLLSYAGAVEPDSGEAFGGVTSNGGRLDAAFTTSPVLFYAYGGYHYLLGRNVLTNEKYESGLGFQWFFADSDAFTWRTGFGANIMGYRYNLRYFTFGHGGYFSPQYFMNVGMPIVVEGDTGLVRYNLNASLGFNWFRENGADAHPGQPALQDDRVALATPSTTSTGTTSTATATLVDLKAGYDGRESMAFAMSTEGRVHIRAHENFEPGLTFAVHTGAEYTEFAGGLQLLFHLGSGRSSAQ